MSNHPLDHRTLQPATKALWHDPHAGPHAEYDPEVRDWQHALNVVNGFYGGTRNPELSVLLNYDQLIENGVFGTETHFATVAFQQDVYLHADGVVPVDDSPGTTRGAMLEQLKHLYESFSA